MDKIDLLSELQQNAAPDGTVQFNFSTDLSVKHKELKILNELESEGYIYRLTAALGYAIYRVL